MATEMISQVWPEWQIETVLGKGSYGTVYKAVRSDSNVQSNAAIKVISIPMDRSELDSLRAEGLTEEGTRTYFQGIVNDFVGEIQLMESLKGTQNIVSVEDYKVVEHDGEIGWEIYIRMELLTPFNTYLQGKTMTEAEVLKLGIDICSALEICEKRKIVHRDIKPENIFINDFGFFKLGDFGIARTLENATGGMSQKGTFNYMAPEIAAGRNYDATVDIYSLGIVLYRLLNGNRLPFIENDEQLLNPNARKLAVDRRMRGDQMAPPCNASNQAAAVIMRACAYSPQVRFATATEMKKALQQVELGVYVVEDVDLDKTVSVRRAQVNLDATVGVNSGWNQQPQAAAPNVQGWSQVNAPKAAPVQQPVYTPPVQPVQPVQPKPVQPAQPQPVQQPVYTPPVHQTTPPVYTPPVHQTTPPVYTPPVHQTTPPVYTPPVKQPAAPNITQKTAKKKWNTLYLAALCLSVAGLGQTETEPSFAIGAGVIAMVLALIGKVQSGKKNMGGAVVGFISILLGTIAMSVNLGYANATRNYNSYYSYYETVYDEETPIIGVFIGLAVMVIFLLIGRKKKKVG